MAEPRITLHLKGRPAERPQLPALLSPAARTAERRDDVFLPSGYLQPISAFDLGPAARSGAGAGSSHTFEAAAQEVLVLELADGGCLITSAARLRATLQQTRPELIGENGEILLEALRAQGAAPGRGLGEAVGGLISKVFSFAVGAVPDAILDAALGQLKNKAELGVSWAGTKALMWAIEQQLAHEPGLYRWVSATGKAQDLEPVDFERQPPVGTMLVFLHGTGSSTLGSFGELRSGDRELWGSLQARFPGGIYGFEHRTLSQSPIENALALLRALPKRAQLCLVSHSRGGLVGDLLCLGDFAAQIEHYAYAFQGTGDADADEARRVIEELKHAHAEQREQLRELAALLAEREIVVQRYVRTASPASGTKLASGNFDVFLSGLLSLLGTVPFFFGSPWYSAFKRVVLEIAKNRTNAHLVPGIEAMLPDSPMARLLRAAPVRPGTAMAVIAGDIQGGPLLRRLGILLTDFLLFDQEDHDLVVNTSAMLAGIAPKAAARVLFEQGAEVSHFRYFVNPATRSAMRDWLVAEQPLGLRSFRPLPDPADGEGALAAAGASRSAGALDRPVVVLLPGIMGSHLRRGAQDRVWFDPGDLVTGGLAKIAWSQAAVEAEAPMALFYGQVCQYLAASHRVETFPYDWRQPLDVLAERLGEFLDRLMRQTQQPIRLLAHSMGGLVVRACIYKRRAVMDALMAREGARLIMLGTPNQGAHSMVENLLGKGLTVRKLACLDLSHGMQAVLDIVAGFRGALQLLPKPGFQDHFQGQAGGGEWHAYQRAETWLALKHNVRDRWFGAQVAGTPEQAALDAGSWLWAQDGMATPSLPEAYAARSVYIFGQAANTPCGLRQDGGQLKMVGTSQGDGTVSWASGRIGGIGRFYYMPVAHGDLLSSEDHFAALAEVLSSGATSGLSTEAPARRDFAQAQARVYDAGPPPADDPETLLRGLMGASTRHRPTTHRLRRLDVAVHAMDLRYISDPIMVGHYERDAIAGPEALIDRELLNRELSERHSLGLYAGARGTATVVLRVRSDLERQFGALSGAVVTGLGSYDRPLSPSDLCEAARTGALRYLLQVIDVLGKADRDVSLSSLLLGYNSSAHLTVAASVEALVRGVMEANARFYAATRLNIRIARLDIVELYLDTAIGATYALRALSAPLAALAEKQGTALHCQTELNQGEGFRQRLFDSGNASYWPRLIITEAEERSPTASPAPLPSGAAPLANKLRFVFVGQRARAESVALQRQAGLIETLVAQQIANPRWNEDFGRMLFQLMVPHDFKDAARQLDRVVLVVDAHTANLPWELMLADEPDSRFEERQPLALRTAVVRQLAAQSFRVAPQQSASRRALLIANPSVAGFAKGFPVLNGQATQDPPDLPGAQAEGEACQALLNRMGYTVEALVGEAYKASDVLAKLYAKPWRILHISAHGVFDLPHADGRQRSGVLLSDGLLITAAEIMAMETVPELVFLNCCHLGQIDRDSQGPGSNKLAASVARELIAIGVRCVVVAGWAVNDESARLFGEVFYAELLQQMRPFGEAVFSARKEVWKRYPEDITWGAFQAYGDPVWLAVPAAHKAGPGAAAAVQFVSPEEMLDELARLRSELARRATELDERERQAQVERVGAVLTQRCPPGWQRLPQLQYALGKTWFDLGQWAQARAAFLLAARALDRVGAVPLHALEKLADVESRLGEARAVQALDAALAGDPEAQRQWAAGEALLDLALQRLNGLDALLAAEDEAGPGWSRATSAAAHSERTALRGATWQRKASLQARRLLSAQLAPAAQDEAGRQMMQGLQQSLAAYRAGEGLPDREGFSPCHALYRLALDALTDWPSPAEKDAALALAQQCRRNAALSVALQPSPWDLLIQPEALLVESLIDGRLGRADEQGQRAFEALATSYTEALRGVSVRPLQLQAMVERLERLSRFVDALALIQHADEALGRSAERLIELAQRLMPGRQARQDRPGKPPVAAAAGAAASAAAPQRKASSRKKKPKA